MEEKVLGSVMVVGGGVKVLVATGQLIGEGFDCRELSTLFLATPIRFNGRLLQYLGRILRPAPGKDKARVYDYVTPWGCWKQRPMPGNAFTGQKPINRKKFRHQHGRETDERQIIRHSKRDFASMPRKQISYFSRNFAPGF